MLGSKLFDIPSYQGTKQPASPKTASSSSVPTASALPSKDVSSSAMKLPATTITTSSSSAPKQGPQYLPLFLYDRFASLSEQIGILEERIGWCKFSLINLIYINII